MGYTIDQLSTPFPRSALGVVQCPIDQRQVAFRLRARSAHPQQHAHGRGRVGPRSLRQHLFRAGLAPELPRSKHDQAAAAEIIAAAVTFVKSKKTNFDLIIPVPASTQRAVQPVQLLAEGIGAALGLPVISCVTITRSASQLKGITDPEKRKEALDGLHAVDARHTHGKNVLLFDDLFRSGATMNAITDVLSQQGRAANVYVLTITRTRSNR